MNKRISIRLVASLADELYEIAKAKGLSVNSLISEMVWDFVEAWKEKYRKNQRRRNDEEEKEKGGV